LGGEHQKTKERFGIHEPQHEMNLDPPNDGQLASRGKERRMEELPEEILEIIRIQRTPRFLDSLAAAALKPEFTLELFARFEDVFADTCARWI